MTEFLLSLTGLHARNESTIQATQDWERGRIGSAALNAAFRADHRALTELQRDVGADYLSDGQMTTGWQDFLRPFTNGFEGIRKGAMVRWFNTNTFYFTPIVHGPISTGGSAVWSKLVKSAARGGKLRVAVPDPLTFSELAEDRYYGDREKLSFAYADALNEELRTLERKGVAYVQFSSPALVARFRDAPVSKERLLQLGEAIRSAKKGVSVKTGFHTFFGDASPYLPAIFDAIPTDEIGFDFTQTDPRSLPRTKKALIAGIADARTTYLESEDELRETVEQVLDHSYTKSLTLSPSSDLRYIPRVSADEKLMALGSLKRELSR